MRAENDLPVNVKAGREIEAVLKHREYQIGLLIATVARLGIDRQAADANPP